jgi:U3 small nucleolar RNA-associated protein 24
VKQVYVGRTLPKSTATAFSILCICRQKISSAMYLKFNAALGPPYRILIDTNFINFSIQNKLDVFKSMMDCLLAKCQPCETTAAVIHDVPGIPIITDCVMAELEKLGSKYKVALK